MSPPEGEPELIVRGDLVLPDRLLPGGGLGLAGGRIAAIYDPDAIPRAASVFDAAGQLVLPGAVDVHVHCYSEPAEGFANATRSAAAGGVTTLVDMPYDAGAPVTTTALFEAKRERLAAESCVDVALLATVPKEGDLDEVPRLAAAGACGFKVSTYETDPVRFPRIHDGRLYHLFRLIAGLDLPCMVHAEDDELVAHETARALAAGAPGPEAHSAGRPPASEALAVVKLLELAYWTGVRLHIVHGTFPRIFELIDLFRRQGVRVTGETCTHYLTLTEDDLGRLGARGKINPPLRRPADRDGLWEQLAGGMIDLVTSDHAPWLKGRKASPSFLDNASGAPGVELLLPLLYSEGVARGRLRLHDLVRLIAAAPARLFALPGKGELRVGADADLAVIDLAARSVVDAARLHSVAGWSPYEGWPLQGRVTATFVRGRRVFDGESLGDSRGWGRFVRPAGAAATREGA